jgi:hypothetical protein
MQHPPSSQDLTFSACVHHSPHPRPGLLDEGEVDARAISGTTGRTHRWTWHSGW